MRKQCPSCEILLPETAFGLNRSLPDGLSFYCKACNRKRNNRWYRDRRRSQGQEVRDHSWIPEGFRWCPGCKQAVPHEDYARNSASPSGFGSSCKPCQRAASNEAYWRRVYGLSRDDVRVMRADQDDKCAICGAESPQHLDHDHATGRIRRLLCQRCNHGLGLFRDDPKALHAAAYYVQFHTSRQEVAAEVDAMRNGSDGADRPGTPPVGSDRRPGGRGTTSRSSGRNSRSRRQTQAGEADG
jgi:hypothetical protein